MIKIFDYKKSLKEIYPEISKAIEKILFSGQLILGTETESFEKEFCEFVGAKYCIGVNSGTAALYISLMALGIGEGDEIITVSNTCVPTISAIETVGAKPVFVDINEHDMMINTELIEKAITTRTKAIIPVHLWGQSVDIDSIMDIAKRNNLKVLEDCAQAVGTIHKGNHVGNFGDLAAFSFYPTKNLGAYGDAGMIVTNNHKLAEKAGLMRMYGYDKNHISIVKGTNARISEIQSAILRVKLRYLPEWLRKRRKNADYYLENIKNKKIKLPYIYKNREHSFHQFVIRVEERAVLIKKLKKKEIQYGIHYPVPVHQMHYYKRKYKVSLPITEQVVTDILSIPVHENLKREELKQIIDLLNKISKRRKNV
jgi:dTDP-4-amino-4,6-dideoxygalactose transaminase